MSHVEKASFPDPNHTPSSLHLCQRHLVVKNNPSVTRINTDPAEKLSQLINLKTVVNALATEGSVVCIFCVYASGFM